MEVTAVASQWQAVSGAGISSLARSAETLSSRSQFGSPRLLQARRRKQVRSETGGLLILAMAKKKVNAYDDAWRKTWYGTGYFAENSEKRQVNVMKTLEKKKVLSNLEKAGLLSKAEGAGLSLSAIEKLGLLSKAESLGLLSLAENYAMASPGVIASYALPCVVASVLSLVLIPDSSLPLVVAQNILAALFFGGAIALFVGSIVLSGLQEE